MPASRLTFDAGPAKISFDASGNLVSVRHADRPGVAYLSAPADCQGRKAGTPLRWRLVERLVDSDEVEVVMVHEDGASTIRFVLRHMFSSGWRVRLAWANLGELPVSIEDLVLPMTVGDECVGWGLAAGAEAAWTALPRDGAGPVLGGRMRLGSAIRLGADGLGLESITLPAGGRYVVQWEWDWYPTPSACGRGQHLSVPWAQTVDAQEVVTWYAGADVAMVTPPRVGVEVSGERYEVEATVLGRYPFELRSAMGITRFDIEWVASVDDFLAEAGRTALGARRTSAGIVRLPGLSHAIVVQRVLQTGLCDEQAVAEEALELFTVHLLDDESVHNSSPTPLAGAYLCGEYERTGDRELLDEAVRIMLEQSRPAPGLGVAAVRVCLALLAADRSAAPVVSQLVRLATQLPELRARLDLPIDAQIAALELLAVTAASPGSWPSERRAPRRPPEPAELRRSVLALGVHLGAGLKGTATAPLEPASTAHLTTVLSLLPEHLEGEPLPEWGWSVQDLSRRGSAALIARLQEPGRHAPAAGPAAAWLALRGGAP